MTEGVLFLYDSVIDTNQMWKQGMESLFQMLKHRGIPFLIMTRVQEQQNLIRNPIVKEENCYPMYDKDDAVFHKAAEKLMLDIKSCIVVSNQKEIEKEAAYQLLAQEKNGYDLMFELCMQLL